MLPPNPVLTKLGYSTDDRLLIIHADDIGNFQSCLDAYRDLLNGGLLSSASTMVPCSWFPATAQLCRTNAAHPNLDMGVHLTLTSEWDRCRWRPVVSGDPQSGLLDGEGFFHREPAAVQQHANLAALRTELEVQIDYALAAGIIVTHIDSHMFTLLHPRLVDVYFDLAMAYGLPPFLLRRSVPEFQGYGVCKEIEEQLLTRVAKWEALGLPLFDDATMMSLDDAQDRSGQLKRKLDAVKPGLTMLILHPTKNTAELREAVPESDWPCRVTDYETFLDIGMRDYVSKLDIHVIGFRELRDLMSAGGG